MSENSSVVVEREVPQSPETVWRALTEPALIEKWLMKNDFEPSVGHHFQLKGEWGAVDCEVLEATPNQALSYSWSSFGLNSVVKWDLAPAGSGTRVRMEQSGFTPDQTQFYEGAKGGWQQFFGSLEQVLTTLS